MSQATNGSVRAYRRRKRFIRRDLQLKIIFGSAFVAALVLVFNFQVPIIGLWLLGETSPLLVESVYAPVSRLLLLSLGISCLLAIPLSIWMGVVFSFHFCGPIHRIKCFFESLLKGRWDQICTLRKTDDLHDVKDEINRFVTTVGQRMRSQRQVMADVRVFLTTHAAALADAGDTVSGLLKRLDLETAEVDRRYGEGAATGEDGPDGGGAGDTSPVDVDSDVPVGAAS